MRRTLRRSCASCAKAKHKCDLQTPRCSRCVARKSSCIYVNEPLNVPEKRTSSSLPLVDTRSLILRSNAQRSPPSNLSTLSIAFGAQSLDPFDTYPLTGLPRLRVQGLMHHFLSKIAFEYYPLDLNAHTNPFIISWWPLALADPTLFNVSLQTASLDDELQAQKGFADSELLMRDAVTLIRRKIDDPLLAFQDATMDAVVTLAAIEHGKGNHKQSKMHIDAVKRMVAVRGGISNIKITNPLTARMVPWVAMLVLVCPQFDAQDDLGNGDGLEPILQWKSINPDGLDISESLRILELHPEIQNVLLRLRSILHQDKLLDGEDISSNLSTDDLHDLTCFTLHRLLSPALVYLSPLSESVKCALSIYMLLIHGATYYSHMELLHKLTFQLHYSMELLTCQADHYNASTIWCLSVGMISSSGTNQNKWFKTQATEASAILELIEWKHVRGYLQRFLWDESRSETIFCRAWQQVLPRNSSNMGMPP